MGHHDTPVSLDKIAAYMSWNAAYVDVLDNATNLRRCRYIGLKQQPFTLLEIAESLDKLLER
jgi:hypothetical protein